jgi:hypothetical protein
MIPKWTMAWMRTTPIHAIMDSGTSKSIVDWVLSSKGWNGWQWWKDELSERNTLWASGLGLSWMNTRSCVESGAVEDRKKPTGRRKVWSWSKKSNLIHLHTGTQTEWKRSGQRPSYYYSILDDTGMQGESPASYVE